MNYVSCAEAAKAMGITVRRIQQLCKQGEFQGAIKDGHTWLIPEDSISSELTGKKKPLPIGVSDFKIATTGYYYVDKTLLIRDFLDTRPMVSLFTRPRRFGKTLNMDMLRVFFEKTQEDTSIYFKDKLIWQCGSSYTCHQGQYPVIFLTFKDVKCLTWKETFQKIRKLISLEFMRHEELEKICDWYDGYKFGNTEIFNPWSVINYIADKCFPRAFWQSTGSNEIIGEIIATATSEITEGLHKLLCGEKLTTYIDTSVIYPEIQNNPYTIYSFLLAAGYLKVVTVYPQNDGNFMCDVAIPNKEIACVYEKEILNRTVDLTV